MKVSNIFKCALFILLFSSGVLSAQPLLTDQDLVITMGNSITELGEMPDGYVSIMRKMMRTLYPERTVYFINAGISGHKSTDMNARFRRDVLQYRPKWVIINVGVNDVWHGFMDNHPVGDGPRGVGLALFSDQVTEMVTSAKDKGIKVMLTTATVIKEDLSSPENTKLAHYNTALRKIAKKHNCPLADLDAAFRSLLEPSQRKGMSDRGQLTYDGVHMLPAGDWLMAETLLEAFRVPAEYIETSRPKVEELIRKDKEALTKSLSRYEEVNYEVGMPRDGEKRIVFFGSSSVDGWNLARDFPNLPFLNRGIGGETTRHMLLRFRQDVIDLKPEAVILFYGSCNDFWPFFRMCTSETRANTIKLIRMAQGNGIRVALGAISPVNNYLPGKDYITSHPLVEVNALNAWMKTTAESLDCAYIDFYSAVADSNGQLDRTMTDDGMHCNEAGYAKWKQVLVPALKEMDLWVDEQ